MNDMSTLPFQQVDVFTAVPFKGNPVAVVLDADGLSTPEMQAIAGWTNLSETTFVCAPTDPAADYRLRIFTPRSELPFAGHPTIGSAHAVLRHGRAPRRLGRLVQECGKGLIDLRIDGDRLFLALPAPAFREPETDRSAGWRRRSGSPARTSGAHPSSTWARCGSPSSCRAARSSRGCLRTWASSRRWRPWASPASTCSAG